MDRCLNPSSKDYRKYGAKGVTVCTQWQDFSTFAKDVGERPGPEYSVDRFPNRRGSYNPLNWRWATVKQQAENKDTTSVVTVDGITDTASATARRLGISRPTFLLWLRRGFDPQAIAEQFRKCVNGTHGRCLFPEWKKEVA
jgi:hypothetical protein